MYRSSGDHGEPCVRESAPDFLGPRGVRAPVLVITPDVLAGGISLVARWEEGPRIVQRAERLLQWLLVFRVVVVGLL